MNNQLIHESSPYLLSHADHAIHWFPWCEEAFEKASQENKPVFLSIGYSPATGAMLWHGKVLKMKK